MSYVRYFIIVFLDIDALDRIPFRVGYITTAVIIALVFARGLFLGVDFCVFMGAWMLALTLVLLFGLRCFLELR